MVRLRPITAADEAVIERWPPYAAEFEDIDYALREGGWLAEFRDRPDTWRYAAEQSGELVAFSLLSVTAAGEGEFRIALLGECCLTVNRQPTPFLQMELRRNDWPPLPG